MKFVLKTKPQGETLRQYIESRAFVTIITGPLGSGKTFASCEKIIKLCCEQKPNKQGVRKTRVYAVRNTYGELFSTTIKDFLDLFGDLGHFFKGSGITPPNFQMKFRLQDKSMVECDLVFIALDRPEAIKKLRGAQLTFCWLNEIKELPKEVLDMIQFRCGRYPSAMEGGPTYYGVMADTNQCDQDHYLYQLAEVEKPEGWEFFTQPGGLIWDAETDTWLANPEAENLNNLPDGYYTKGQAGKSHSWVKVNLANQYGTVESGRPIYEEQYLESAHLNDKVLYNPEAPLVIGLDFGLTPSCVITQPTPTGGVNILDEIVTVNTGISQFATNYMLPLIAREYRDAKEYIYIGDPAGSQRAQTDEQTVFKTLADLGIYCEAANTNNIEARLEAVRYLLEQMRQGRAALQMHSRCDYLRKGFNGGYKYRRLNVVGTERFHEVPDKNKYSHIHDALQYVALYYKDIQSYSVTRKEEVDSLIQRQYSRRMTA